MISHEEYAKARQEAKNLLGITESGKDMNTDLNIKIASKMPTVMLQAVVNNQIELPSMAFWNTEWVRVCEDELFERILLKSDKCL